MSLDGAISAAVDTAVSATSAPESPSGATAAGARTTPSAPVSSGPTPPEAPAAPSGLEGAAVETGSPDATTTRSNVPAATPESPPAGEPPQGKWAHVLENARVKERTETRAKIFEEYGLADGLDPVEVRAHLDLLRRDPQTHAELTLQALKRDGTYRPREGDTPDTVIDQRPALPEPALVSVDGQRAYTADQVQQLVNVALMNFRAQLSGELQPLQAMHQQARIAQVRAEAQTYAGEAVREASTWHRFSELTPRIREIMLSDKRTTLLSAYNRALQEDLQTSTTQLKAETRRQTLDEIKLASEANTVRPGAAATAKSGARPARGGLDARLDRAIHSALTSAAAR